MLDPSKPVSECSTQELLEALMLQAKFNEFSPKQVLSDLYAVPHLWTNFFMGPQIVEHEKYCLFGLFLLLRDINYRWHADTLYVRAKDDECVFPLIDYAEKWQADSYEIFDRKHAASSIMGYEDERTSIIAYWWD